jgi:hypothetical protein
MELLLAIGIVLFALISPALWKSKPGRKRHSAMSGAFAAMDEIFHPAGKQATEQLAEQTQATKPLPSPEDQKL